MRKLLSIIISMCVGGSTFYLYLQMRYERQLLDNFGVLLHKQGPHRGPGSINFVQRDLEKMVNQIVNIQINSLSSAHTKRAGKLLQIYMHNTRAFGIPVTRVA